MGRPIDVIFALTCDRQRLRRDVRKIADANKVFEVDCWIYLKRHPDTQPWLRIVAAEEVERLANQVRRVCEMINTAPERGERSQS